MDGELERDDGKLTFPGFVDVCKPGLRHAKRRATVTVKDTGSLALTISYFHGCGRLWTATALSARHRAAGLPLHRAGEHFSFWSGQPDGESDDFRESGRGSADSGTERNREGRRER